jgi:hypothetical protein
MLCYRDTTFCPFQECKKFDTCPSAYTTEVSTGAKQWMGEDAPVALYASEPECFEEKR